MKKTASKFPWYIILFSLYPPLALWAHNFGQIGPAATYRAFITCLIIGVAVLILLQLWLRNWERAGVLTSIVLLLFFSYGHIYSYLENKSLAGIVVGRHRVLAVIWLLLALISAWWVTRKLRSVGNLHAFLATVAVVLTVFPVISFASIGFSEWQDRQMSADPSNSNSRAITDVKMPDKDAPDVYYIILDGYGRSDVLLNKLDFDNSAFLSNLKDDGFYVAGCSQSNYGMTALSLASSLNMDYITSLGSEFTPDNANRFSPLWNLIKNSATETTFRQMGYKVVAFETGYDWTEFRNADYFFSAPTRGLNGFESLVLRDSAGVLLDDLGVFDPLHLTPETQKQNLILYVLNKMKSLPDIPGPKFVFIHLVIPHQPFVFGPDGKPFVVAQRTLNEDKYYSPSDYLLGYGNQVRFISTQIPDIVKTIIQKSRTPPVIIIQGDHGPAQLERENRMGILNAYYFPYGRESLYSTITPVNTFRVVFDVFFKSNLSLLTDTSYYSKYSQPYAFEVIPNKCNTH